MKTKVIIVLIIFLSIYIIFFDKTIALTNGLEEKHIIDWHAHVAGLGYGNSGNFINQAMKDNYRFDFFMKWMDVNEEQLKQHGDQIIIKRLNDKITQSKYVDQAIVLALDGIIKRDSGQLDKENTQFYVDNDYIAKETAKYPNLLFGASINPERKNSVALLNKAHQQGAVLIKWIPSIMHLDPADKRFEAFYKRMAELNMPLLTHTGMEKSFPNTRDELADPHRLALALKLGVTVIAAHIATTGESEGEDNFQRILPMIKQYPNLYVDISSLTQINKLGYLAKAIKVPGLKQRMIYGTDWPLQHFPLVSPWYHINHIGIKNAWNINSINNLWDRDVKLKQAFGIPNSVFNRTLGLIEP